MLDPIHNENMQWMLRSLELRPYSPVPLDAGSSQDVVDEANEFDDVAYGATLALIYFRALTPPLRERWDQKMNQRVTDLSKSLREAVSSNDANFRTAQGGFSPPSSPQFKAWRASARKDQILRKQVEFLMNLQSRKVRTFPENSDGAVNDDVKVGQNPWCQSDSEFRQVVAGELAVSVPNPKPVIPHGFGTEAEEEGSRGKMLNTVLTSKASKYIDKLLEIGEDHVAEVLSKGVSKVGLYLVRKVPIADLIIDWIKDTIAGNALDGLVRNYRTDRDRRLFLKLHGWGNYVDPETPRPPSASDFSQQVMK